MNVKIVEVECPECNENIEVIVNNTEECNEINNLKNIIFELEKWLKDNIKLKPLQVTYFFEIDHKQKSISEIELNELKRVLNKIQELKEKYK